jgi:hypothetical protein
MAEERGLSKEQAALLISLIGAFNTAGRVISGQFIAVYYLFDNGFFHWAQNGPVRIRIWIRPDP